MRDSAAFGDLDVTTIEPVEPTVVTLEFRAPCRSLLRTLGVRRAVVMESFARRPERVVTHWLEANAGASMQAVLDRCRATVRPSAAARTDLDPVEGRVIRTRHLLRPEGMNTHTIVNALRSPVELAISPERGAVGHIEEQVAGILFRVPEFHGPRGRRQRPARLRRLRTRTSAGPRGPPICVHRRFLRCLSP